MKLKEIMTSPPITLDCESEIEEAAVLMRLNGVRRIVVTGELGEIVGTVSISDVEGASTNAAIDRAFGRYIPKPGISPEKESTGIPGLYLG